MKITNKHIYQAFKAVEAARGLSTQVERIEWNYLNGEGPYAFVTTCVLHAGNDLPFGGGSLVLAPRYPSHAALREAILENIDGCPV